MRVVFRLLVCTALLVATASVLAGPAEAGGIEVSAQTSTPRVAVGDKARVKGVVTHRPRGTVVTIQQKYKSGGGWAQAGQTTVNRKGAFRFSERVNTSKSRYYRACVPKGRGLKCSASAFVEVVKPKAGSIDVSSWTAVIDAGQTVTVIGTASENLLGQVVQLQIKSGKQWTSLGQSLVNPDGSYVVAGPVSQAGKAVALQVAAPATSVNLLSVSRSFAVTSFGWYFLSEGTPKVVSGYPVTGAQSINGTTYPNSVSLSGINGAGPGSFTVEIDLSRDCTTFVTVVGMNDASNTEARYSGRISADSVEVWSQASMAIGQAFPVQVNVTSALRLRFNVTRDTWANGRLAFGDARVRCAF